jgi:hypothetical protein
LWINPAEVEQNADGGTLVHAQQAEQEVLGATGVLIEAQRLAQRQRERSLRSWRPRPLAEARFLTGGDPDELSIDAAPVTSNRPNACAATSSSRSKPRRRC